MKVTTGAVESLLQDNLPESNGLQEVATDHCPLLIPPGWFFSSFAFPRKLQQNQTETQRLLGAYNYWNKGKSIASDLPWPRIQRFLISAGSMRWYLQLIQVAQGIQLLQDIKSIHVVTCIIMLLGYVPPAQSQNCERPTEHNSGSGICIFVQGGTGGSRLDPYRWPPAIMCMLLTNVSDSMGLA